MNRWPHDVTVLNAGVVGTDRYNNPVLDWENATPTAEKGFVQPRAGSEDTVGGDFQIGDAVVYLEPSTVVTGRSRVKALGRTWEVVGPPEAWSTGSPLDHVRAVLRHVQG